MTMLAENTEIKPSILRRHFTADSLNLVVNDPSVYPWVRGTMTGYLDLAPLVRNRNNILLMGEHGGVLLLQHQPGLYEVHTQVLPAGRGQWTLDMATEALHWMFTKTDAIEIVSRVPKGNLGARALAKRTNAVFEFRRERGWSINDKVVPADVYSWKVQDWMRWAPNLIERGEWFHKRLEKEYKKLGRKLPSHADDEVHDRYVGAAIDMAFAGNPHKGVVLYNRWAKMAGYAELKIVTESPLVLDIVDALLMFRGEDFWCMSIR